MSWLAAAVAPGGIIGGAGTTYWTRAEQDEFRELELPGYLLHLSQYGSSVNYRNRLYICGQYTDNAVFDEWMRMSRLGILAPTLKPVIAAGGGTGISASDVIGYASFYDEITGERSSLSGGSVTIPLSNDDVLWTNLPTTSDDRRVTHIELWRSVDGALPRLSVRRQLGVASVIENVPTLALGEAMVTTFERFPRCRYNAIYHDRHVLAGDPEHPDTVYLSGIFLPERYEGLSFKTRNGEPIVGLINVRDVLLILCPESSYILQGYTETDAVMSLSEPELGAIGHFQLDMIHGNAIIPNRKSIYMFNGAWHNLMLEGQYEWRRELKANPEFFENAYGKYDSVSHRYKFRTNLENVQAGDIPFGSSQGGGVDTSLYWCADTNPVTPELSGTFAQPNWSFDYRGRKDTVMARLARPGFSKTGFYTGSNDGFIREENYDINDDDDADGFLEKRFSVRTGAMLMQNPGGDIEEGKSFPRTWVHLESELCEWDLYVFGGDEHAWRQQSIPIQYYNADVQFHAYTLASYAESQNGNLIWTNTPQTVHSFVTEGVAGRAVTVLVTVPRARQATFRGFGGWFGPGPATRPPEGVTEGS